ncbi:hypothetical protein BP5796_02273 [Coleophoma crateriformis]|uniref:PLC-like phosphodiesterase n=1 Tax=Coleophoma crateriformis TaxID=565419 RepID=A0A3D8SZB2_9HELO|nr:hypothetical protein BP5796_02273 [Coleophoma crateriformis]
MRFSHALSGLSCVAAASAIACNGYEELCARKYSNITQIGTHDSAFVGWLPTENQADSVTAQLDAGIRFLQAQTHEDNSVLTLCHTSCTELNAGPLSDYLTTVKTWLDANPNEVLTLLLTNGDYVDVTLFGDVMVSTNLSSYAYTPSSQLTIDEWPTLQTLIDSGDRLVVFLDYDGDTSKVPYILPEFSYFWETAYDVTDSSFSSCALDRPSGSNGAGLMYIVNHFLDFDVLGIKFPDTLALSTTNAASGTGSIIAQTDLCESTWSSQKPKAVLVDYFEEGDVFTAQSLLNGL